MGTLKKKSKINKAMSNVYSDSELAHRRIEHTCLNIMDDMRIVVAYVASCHLANGEYGNKRLMRIEEIFNKYIAEWRKDAHAETIELLMHWSHDRGYDYKQYGDKVPSSYIWAEFNRRMPKKYNAMYSMQHKTRYITGLPNIITLFTACALEQIRMKYKDISRSEIERCLKYLVIDMQQLSDSKSGLTIKAMADWLKANKGYVFGKVPGSWHEVVTA